MDLPYLAYFHLKEEPFSTVPSPRYFFLTSVHSTALEKTAYVVGAKKGLTTVFGDTGTGKSSLARLLHQKFLDSGFISTLLTNPNYPRPALPPRAPCHDHLSLAGRFWRLRPSLS